MNKQVRFLPFLVLMFACMTNFQSLTAGEIIRIDSRSKQLLPKGKEVDGMVGDWIMKNDKVIAVIAAAYPDREANQMVSSIQGAVIDFTTLAANNDQLVVFYPQGARVDVPAADTIIAEKSKGNFLQLKVLKYATTAEPYTAETTYILRDGKSALEVNTVYHNVSPATINLKLADRLRCDNDLTDMAPAGNGQLAFIFNKWYQSAYGVAVLEGNLFTKVVPGKPKLTDVGREIYYPGHGSEADAPVQLAAGQTVDISRLLLTGNDVPDLNREYSAFSGHSFQTWNTVVKDVRSNIISDAFVYVKNKDGELVSASLTDKKGNSAVSLDKGEYTFNITKLGHDTVSQVITIPEKSGGSSFVLQPLTSVRLSVEDSDGKLIPVKVELRGKEGTRDPFLGPFKRSNGAGNNYYSNSKKFEIPVPPGTYELAISHGPEYDVILKTVTLKRGETANISEVMKRSYRTPNWIVADMHNHTTGSGDSNAEVGGRVINLAASGIEFAPATEHNRISTFTDVILQLGLQKYIASSAGVELSGRPGPGDINHQIGFPVKIQDGKRGYGAPKTDKDPYVQMKRLYDYDDGKFKVMQHNHPNIGKLYFDKNMDGVADGGFGTAPITHVLEINGTLVDFPRILNGEKTRSRLLPWLQMLNLGYHIYATANSDAHVVGHGAGSVFSYIYTKHDSPEKIDDVEIAHQVKDGHVVISNGPFMDVRMNGALPGDGIKAENGKVNVKVKVLAANWCSVNTVQILVNGRADPSLIFTKEKNTDLFKHGADVFEKEIPVSLTTDAHLIVIAFGKGETVGKVQGAQMRNAPPIAMSNPVFVDVDGNGFVPNKDLLDNPMPSGKFGRPAPGEETDPE